jgi:hypothetical protein
MRAFYRGYHAATGRRAGQVRRLHIMREDGKFPGKQALCGAAGWGHTNPPPVVIDPLPVQPPEGLEWCRSCVGHAADLVGALAGFARMIAGLDDINRQKTAEPQAAAEPAITPEGTEGRCSRCRQTRPLHTFSYVPTGWMEFVAVRLCPRCHSLSALEDEDGQLDSGPLLNRIGATS